MAAAAWSQAGLTMSSPPPVAVAARPTGSEPLRSRLSTSLRQPTVEPSSNRRACTTKRPPALISRTPLLTCRPKPAASGASASMPGGDASTPDGRRTRNRRSPPAGTRPRRWSAPSASQSARPRRRVRRQGDDLASPTPDPGEQSRARPPGERSGANPDALRALAWDGCSVHARRIIITRYCGGLNARRSVGTRSGTGGRAPHALRKEIPVSVAPTRPGHTHLQATRAVLTAYRYGFLRSAVWVCALGSARLTGNDLFAALHPR
jgi:hypothetical protein